MNKPTLAIIGSKGYPFVYSGYETLITELAARLQDSFEVHIYCHRGLFKTRPAIVDGARLHYIPALETKWLTHVSHNFLSTLHALARGYDLYFYVNSCNGPYGYLLAALGKRAAINTDGVEWARPQIKGLGAAFYKWTSRLAAKSFGVVICDSRAMQAIYAEEFGAQTELIAYGAAIAFSDKPELLQQFGLTPESYYLVVGRMIPDNNAELLIQGFLGSGSSKKLVIVGDLLFGDPYKDRLLAYASEKILFTGFVTAPQLLNELYANAYCYVHGHECGGTNPALLQALSCGCCVLALDISFNREVLSDDEYGIYFDKNIASVSAKLAYLESHPEVVAAYRKKARDRISEAYTWEKITGQYEHLFQRMLLRT